MISMRLDKGSEKLVFSWLVLAVSSLIFAGLFALFIAMARTPYVQDLLPGIDNAKIYLAGHVVLSLVIWFLAFNGILWAITATGFSGRENFCTKIAATGVFISAAGTVLIITPALLRTGTPVFTNYVPVIDHPLYYSGLVVFASGLIIYLFNIFATYFSAWRDGENIFRAESFGMFVAGIGVVVACLCYLLAYLTFPGDLKKFVYLEHFFWSGGHILQFVNSAGMLVAWILLTKLVFDVSPVKDRTASILFSLFILFMAPAPLFFFIFKGGEDNFKDAFTLLMQVGYIVTTLTIGSGVLKVVVSAASGRGIVERVKGLPWGNPGFSALLFSLLLFATGGIFAVFISGSNTKIPSHYHGVIGAVTMSFMGLTYYILPMIKRKIKTPRLVRIQPFTYGIGQLLFALGLFWAGGHGVSRKTYGVTQGLDSVVKKASMLLMGVGGLIAIVGGASFVYIVLRALFGGRSEPEA